MLSRKWKIEKNNHELIATRKDGSRIIKMSIKDRKWIVINDKARKVWAGFDEFYMIGVMYSNLKQKS